MFKKQGGVWVAITGSAVSKSDLATVTLGWYSLVKKAVNESAEIKEHLQKLLLKALEALGALGPESGPWHAVISGTNSNYEYGVLLHERGTTGLAMYQLAIKVARGAMTREIAETMAAVNLRASMTKDNVAGEAPHYFTMPIGMKRKSSSSGEESGESGGSGEDSSPAKRGRESTATEARKVRSGRSGILLGQNLRP